MTAAPEPELRRGELERRRSEELQVLGPAMGVGHGGHHDERGARMGLEELGDGKSAGRSGEAGDTQTDFSLGERFRQRFESRPLSQHFRTV
jgi:hypothetical protein